MADSAEQPDLPRVAHNCLSCDARSLQRNDAKALLLDLEQCQPRLFTDLQTALQSLSSDEPKRRAKGLASADQLVGLLTMAAVLPDPGASGSPEAGRNAHV